MDNLLAGINFLLIMMKRGSRISFSYPASKNAKTSPPGGGSFKMEWVAALKWNGWQL
jgi:hypothetical protein